ncbi:MAG TPA: 1-deoxy-D-xylulose-5-phosphate reductoisomerase [Burkholderiales bacterium]|nr:1-deoxy-D-xylulose-5-phosphate reductoisomerase [Burkholderiales bacterium]
MTAIAVLGSTGSIGVSTLDVVARHRERFRVHALAAHSDHRGLLAQCLVHRPRIAILEDATAARELHAALRAAGLDTQVESGRAALDEAVRDPAIDVVMAAIVGAAGLSSTLAAAAAGRRVLVANKESLVVGGALLVAAARAAGATLIPIDSEHNAILQCLPARSAMGEAAPGVRRILLTASGGPFLRRSRSDMARVTPDEACAHPRWRMGRKISVDSATLMNKGLELIEACVLFGMEPRQVEVVVHPQSIVHSMVEYVDGSVLAQLGNPDMRTPIAHALGWPDRIASGVESLDLVAAGRLEFEAPDLQRFPALRLARLAAEAGGTSPAVINAANEVAVAAFLAGRLAFPGIPDLIEAVLDRHQSRRVDDLADVLEADRWARHEAESMLLTGRAKAAT